MKKASIFLVLLVILPYFLHATNKGNTILPKENGNVLFAYKGFENFLYTAKSWKDYQETVLVPFPALQAVHDRYVNYGLIDSKLFRNEVESYTIEDYKSYLNEVNEEKLIQLYDSVIAKMDELISPLDSTDLCFFLPYGKDCFIQNVSGRKTIYISIKYTIEEMYLILVHEYAHSLHYQRRPDESTKLAKWVVEEGIASYVPTLLSKSYSIYDGLWMMPRENVDWCRDNEQRIISSMLVDMDRSDMETDKKYRAGGEGFAEPPKGFPEKTAYYMGYRVVEECFKKGYTLSEICNMNSKVAIELSEVFKHK